MKFARATLLALILATGPSTHASAQNILGGLLYFPGAAPPETIEVKTGRFRPTRRYVNLEGTAVELEADATVEGNFGDPNTYFINRSMPVVQYVAYVRAGESLTARAVSTDAHLLVRFGTSPGDQNLGISPVPSPNGPKQAQLSYTNKKDRLIYITVSGMLPKVEGGFYTNRSAPVGRFTIQLGDPNRPFAAPTRYAEAATPQPAGDSLESTYASLCAAAAAPESETCAALRKAMVAKLSAAPKPEAPKPAPAPTRTRGKPAPAKPVTAQAAPTAARPPVDPVRWAAAEAAVAVRLSPFTQVLANPYGKNGKLDIKLPAGQGIEVLVEMPDGSGNLVFCLNGKKCTNATVRNQSTAFRFRPTANDKLQILVGNTSSSAAGKEYRITTRGDTNGEGVDLLTRFERLAGPPQIISSTLAGLPIKAALDYTITEPSRSGTLRYRLENGNTEQVDLAINPAGNLRFTQGDQSGIVQPGLDGTLFLHYAPYRVGFRIAEDGSFRNIVSRRSIAPANSPADIGGFDAPVRDEAAVQSSERAVLAMLAAGPKRIENALAARMLDWGPLAAMAGRSWRVGGGSTGDEILEYSWQVEGYSLIIKRWPADVYGLQNPTSASSFVHDGETGKLKGSTSAGGQNYASEASIDRAGALLVRAADGNRSTLALASPNEIIETPIGAFDQPGAPTRISALAPTQLADISARARRLRDERAAQLAAQQAAQQAAKKKEGGGFGGFLAKVAQGAAIISSDSAYNAYLVGQLNTAAPGLGDAVSIAAGGGNVGAPGIGAAGGQGAGPGQTRPGSYAAKKPIVGPGCSGFTPDNYESRALAEGPDKQLNSLCGYSMSLFVQYRRAVDGGYSEADAERTFQAHSKASLVAEDFYKNAR